MRKIIFLSIIAALMLSCAQPATETDAVCSEVIAVENEAPSLLPANKQFKLIWNDEFNGDQLDTTKWRYRTEFWQRDAFWFAKPEDNAVELKNGLAYLKVVKREDGQFVSPQLQTSNLIWDYVQVHSDYSFWPMPQFKKPLFKHRYGYYECRCKLQKIGGWWSAFWMQSESIGATQDPRYSGIEHDIMECFAPGQVGRSVFHYNGYGSEHKEFLSPRNDEVQGDGVMLLDTATFHTFGMLWEPDGYTLFVDGAMKGSKVGQGENEVVSQVPEFLLVSTECMNYRNNNCTGTASPDLEKAYKAGDAFIVDYVRVFDIVE